MSYFPCFTYFEFNSDIVTKSTFYTSNTAMHDKFLKMEEVGIKNIFKTWKENKYKKKKNEKEKTNLKKNWEKKGEKQLKIENKWIPHKTYFLW